MTIVPAERVPLRVVFGVREFRALLGSSVLSLAGDQIARIAVAVLVYQRTGSAFAVTATVACSYLTWIVGGPLLATVADRAPRRTLMVLCDLLRAGLVALLVLPDVPLPVVFAVLVLAGLLAPPFDAARSAVLPEVLDGEAYVVGNAVQGAAFQAAHVAGFLLGGAVVAVVGARGALAVDAATFLLSAVVLRCGLRERGTAPSVGTSLLADTAEGLRLVASEPQLRRLLAFGLLGALVMIAPEGLAVPIADHFGGGPRTAGVLTAAVPAGFLLGAVLVLRVPADRRLGLLAPLTALAAGALALTPLATSAGPVVALWVVCGVGGALGLVANAAYMQAVPGGLRGRAFGVAATMLMATQGLALLALGALAQLIGPAPAVALAGAAALALLCLLVGPGTVPRARPAARPGQP